jgi:hypothetical protein
MTAALDASFRTLLVDAPPVSVPGPVGRWVTEVFNEWPEGSREAAEAATAATTATAAQATTATAATTGPTTPDVPSTNPGGSTATSSDDPAGDVRPAAESMRPPVVGAPGA